MSRRVAVVVLLVLVFLAGWLTGYTHANLQPDVEISAVYHGPRLARDYHVARQRDAQLQVEANREAALDYHYQAQKHRVVGRHRALEEAARTAEHERQVAAAAAAVKAAAAARVPVRPPAPAGDVWWALALCESGGNPRAVSPSGRYRGAFQFDFGTWASVGLSGDPIDHSYGVQLGAAQRLHAARGWQPWPACSARLGLR